MRKRLDALIPLVPAVVLLAAICLGVSALAQSRWDGTYREACVLTMDGGNQRCVVAKGAYVMVDCAKDTNIGSAISDGGPVVADAGYVYLYSCLLADAGQACPLYHFTLGERFYSQLLPAYDNVTTYNAGTDTCRVYEGK